MAEITNEMRAEFRRLQEQELDWQENHWNDVKFDFQMKYNLDDADVDDIEEGL